MTESTPTPNCNSCVFVLDSSVTPSVSVAALGTPSPSMTLCSRLAAVLSLSPTLDDERGRRIGAACSHFTAGDKGARAAAHWTTERAAGWKIATATVDDPDHEPTTATAPPGVTCVGCANYVRNSVMFSEDSPAEDFEHDALFPCRPYYCAATGSLHPYSAGDLSKAPTLCGEYVDGTQSRPDPLVQFSTASLFDHIRQDLNMADQPAESAQNVERAEDPREPTEAESAAGINGFVRVFSDDGKRWVDLPTFDPAMFSDAEREKIPASGDDAAPELFRDYANLSYRIAAAWALGETPALVGAPGLGKSQAAYYLAWRMGLPLERVSITSASQLDDLAGYTELVRHETGGNVTEFVHGRIPQAWAKPCVLLLDEPNAGPPEVWQFLRPLTDAAKQLVLDVNHGQRIPRHEHSYLMMAMNPAWDYRNTGVTALSDADGRRLVHITVAPPDTDTEREIIVDHLKAEGASLSPSRLDVLVGIGSELRTLATDPSGGTGALQITWGIAQQVKVAKLLRYFDFADAFRLAGADNVEPEQRELILGVVNRLTATLNAPRKGRSNPRGGRSRGAATLGVESNWSTDGGTKR